MAGLGGATEFEEGMRPSEQMAYLNDLEYAKKHRGALVDALVLPDHDLNRITYPGHAPAGPFGDFGPLAPSKGTRNGDVLGATHSVLNLRNAAKNLEECKNYIALGCDVNAQYTASRKGDTMGWTALHFASKWDRIDVIEELLANGADPLIRTWDGETALVIARKLGNWAAFRMLENFMKTGFSDQHGIVEPYTHPASAHAKDNREAEATHYNDPAYLDPPRAPKPYVDLNDDDDFEMIPKRKKAPKAWELYSDASDLEPEDFD